jgi:hypothetical protein
VGDAVDPVQRAGELTHTGCESEQADHSVDVDEEDRFCFVRYQGVVPLLLGNDRQTDGGGQFSLKGKARGPIARRESFGNAAFLFDSPS